MKTSPAPYTTMAELLQDKARLDWLQTNRASLFCDESEAACFSVMTDDGDCIGEHCCARTAIDMAMEQFGPTS